MQNRKIMPLAVALLMFPQVAQTLYSPALADFGRVFSIAPNVATQALTVYFLAFAVGVVVWGMACDRVGRRMSMLAGLGVFSAASAAAVFVESFRALLLCQGAAAFGAAAGSVVTQTILRDRFAGLDLARAFSIVGMVLATSPAIGLFTGATAVHQYGYEGVMVVLLVVAVTLLVWTATTLPETKPAGEARASLKETLRMMMMDPAILRAALLIAIFNISLFSYYALGPFIFQRLKLSNELYGFSGAILAIGASLGSWLNKQLLRLGINGEKLIASASGLVFLGGAGVQLMKDAIWFLVPLFLVVVAFGLAVPNVLGTALSRYQDRLGTAGALFGLTYYLIIGGGMALVGMSEALGGALIACGGFALLLCLPRLSRGPTSHGR